MRHVQLAMAVTLLGMWATLANGQIMPQQGQAPAAGGTVTLPYLVSESGGNQWRIFQGGWLQQQGNQPLYSQGAMLLINGNQVSQNNNEGASTPKPGNWLSTDSSPTD